MYKILTRFLSVVLASFMLQSTAIGAEVIWLDVRSLEEFNQGHLEGALHVPHSQIAEKIVELIPNKDAEVKLYCRSGRRSGLALEAMEQLGYRNVSNAGAYSQLKEEQAEPKVDGSAQQPVQPG